MIKMRCGGEQGNCLKKNKVFWNSVKSQNPSFLENLNGEETIPLKNIIFLKKNIFSKCNL